VALFCWFTPVVEAGVKVMMGERQVDQGALFYEFSFEKQVPTDHMLRSIERFFDLGPVRTHLARISHGNYVHRGSESAIILL
jgi:hypothetical protein